MIVNEREKTIYKQGFMSGSNAAQTAIKAAEHRAEVAERALLDMCRETAASRDFANKWQKYYKEQAEREIEEVCGE